jgi:superfamily I DNA and/or RNA helicase
LRLLQTAPASKLIQSNGDPTKPDTTIAILTPYTAQAKVLKQTCPGLTVSSIDGFQGQEVDLIIFVTVRCNQHGGIGFLKDMRRLNRAVTRAKAGLIIIGNQATLISRKDSDEACRIWSKLIDKCAKVRLTAEDEGA